MFGDRVLSDCSRPDRAFAFFTFVAGSNVLGLRLLAAGQILAGEVLAAVAALVWVVLSYGIPTALAASRSKTEFPQGINGTWLIWVVGTQSVASSAASVAILHPAQAAILGFIAVATWGFAVVLYVLLMAIVVSRLLLVGLAPEQLTPAYWITMGATAITVFAAARILSVPTELPMARPVLAGLTMMLWAFGTWWIPLMVVLGIWRHLLRGVPLAYEPTLWSMVFPLGMYAAASQAFGTIEHLRALQSIAGLEIWLGLVVWLATFVGMLASWLHQGPLRPA